MKEQIGADIGDAALDALAFLGLAFCLLALAIGCSYIMAGQTDGDDYCHFVVDNPNNL